MVQFVDRYLDGYIAQGHLGGFCEAIIFFSPLIFPLHIFQGCEKPDGLKRWTPRSRAIFPSVVVVVIAGRMLDLEGVGGGNDLAAAAVNLI